VEALEWKAGAPDDLKKGTPFLASILQHCHEGIDRVGGILQMRILVDKRAWLVTGGLLTAITFLTRAAVCQHGAVAIPKRVVGMNYPRLAHLAGVQGKVVLTARFLVGGSVGDVRIISGDAVLAQAAKESLSRWLFSGCKSSSNACEAKVTFTFVLSGECDISNCPSEVQIDLPDSVTVRSKMPRAIVN
jgi:hypothetical protein